MRSIREKLSGLFGGPDIEFFYTIPGVEDIMPIIPAKEYKHEWVARASKQCTEKMRKPKDLDTWSHTARCPGIFSLMRTGYIVRAWQDISITTNGDGASYHWESPVDQKALCSLTGHAVGSHTEEQLHDFFSNWPSNQLRTTLKLCMPWRIKVKKGFKAVFLPVYYADEDRFEAHAGAVSSDFPYASININVKWRVLDGKVLIAAGTPLVQILVVPETEPTHRISRIPEQVTTKYMLALNSTFVINYAKAKKYLSKMFSQPSGRWRT